MDGIMNNNEADSAQSNTVPAYSWYALSVLVLVYVLNFIDRNILSILANDIKADLGLTDADLGFLYGTAFGVFYALFGIPLGRLADNWRRTRLMAIGLALWSFMTMVSGFAQSRLTLGAARIGVGIGEASASPSAYSLISDWFPKHMRATAIAIYSAGLYLGGGISLLIGGWIVDNWNMHYPDGGPLNLAGWQVAFLAVGFPGILLAVWVLTLREPVRGGLEGIPQAENKTPFGDFFAELLTVIPPFTLAAAYMRGTRAFIGNVVAAAIAVAIAYGLGTVFNNYLQWGALGIGYYAVFSWASALRTRDPATFKLIWGTPAFLYTILGYGMVAFAAYAVSFWAAPYAERVLGASKTSLGFWIGGGGALGGFVGAILGGAVADKLRAKNPSGRILVIAFGVLAPIIPLIIAFTTQSLPLFYALNFVFSLVTSAALGGAAATTQDLVQPRMRGTATATFFIATTLVALGLGPYYVGQISTLSGDLSTGILSVLCAAPIGAFCLWRAYRLLPNAEATRDHRAQEV